MAVFDQTSLGEAIHLTERLVRPDIRLDKAPAGVSLADHDRNKRPHGAASPIPGDGNAGVILDGCLAPRRSTWISGTAVCYAGLIRCPDIIRPRRCGLPP